MAINFWRRVEYTEDGCNEFECLNCYSRWESRTSPKDGWSFCPICGAHWDGEHKSNEHVPQYMGAQFERPVTRIEVQRRETWMGDPGAWECHHRAEIRGQQNRKYIIDDLKKLREKDLEFADNDLRFEYRIIISK